MILKEAGYEEALLGLSLNKNQDIDKMGDLSKKLCKHDYGHNKFLEMIDVWIDITVPRYVWSDFDTYRLTTKQSESTNHTIMKRPLTKNDFEDCDISDEYLWKLNDFITFGMFEELKRALPEGFLQRRIWKLNYKNIFNIVKQRKHHKLYIVRKFCDFLLNNLEHKVLINLGELNEHKV
jgi:hypothetical protein